nr:nuclear transport factor 2 family protein [Hyphomonadaceae bacterium]
YLRAAAVVLGNDSFRYVGEWHGSGSAVLEFACELDGIAVNGIDMIGWNEAGQITSFKVMVRPLKAINMVHAMMGAQLAAA